MQKPKKPAVVIIMTTSKEIVHNGNSGTVGVGKGCRVGVG
jgi:hypothetical protein